MTRFEKQMNRQDAKTPRKAKELLFLFLGTLGVLAVLIFIGASG
jgi:hypothetical protein